MSLLYSFLFLFSYVMIFPLFDKNAVKECRCNCCNSGPLDINTVNRSDGGEEGAITFFFFTLSAHTLTQSSLWFISDCAINALRAAVHVVLALSTIISFFYTS